ERDHGAFGDVAGEGHRSGLVVDGEHGAHEGGVVVGAAAEGDGEEQGGGGQAAGALAEVLLVELERGASVDLEVDIALGVVDAAFGAEEVPAALGAVADTHARAVEPGGDDEALARASVAERPGALEG